MLRGLDVSHYQGSLNWGSLKTSYGLGFGACKATDGASFVDSQFDHNWAGIRAAGLTRIAYHYAHPESSVTAQAAHFLSVVKPVPGDVLCLDLERGTTMAATNAWAKSFAAYCRKNAPGCVLIIYMGTGYAASNTGRGMSNYFDFWWVARYPGLRSWPGSFAPKLAGNTTGWTAPHMWQWTDRFAGKYDADISTLTAAQLTQGGAPVALTTAEADMIIDRLLARQLTNPLDPTKTASFQTHLVWANAHATQSRDAVNAQAVALAAIPATAATAAADAIKAAIQNNLVTVQINAREATP